VDAAYGEQKSYLEPLRSPWEGAEGIIWLCVADSSALETGAFYLDRTAQVKHMSGLFFSEGSFTQNSDDEVNNMIQQLRRWSHCEKSS